MNTFLQMISNVWIIVFFVLIVACALTPSKKTIETMDF